MMKSILCCIHQSYMQRIVTAIREEYDCPLVCVVMWQQAEEDLAFTEEQKQKLGKFYSVPQFYLDNISTLRALPDTELDAQQASLELELGITENVRTSYYDRMFQKIPDFRDCRNLQVIYLMLAKKIFDENDIGYALLGRELYFWNILADVALMRGAPAMSVCGGAHIGNRYYGRDSAGQQLGMREAFARLTSGDDKDFAANDLHQADELYDQFVNQPERPAYSKVASRSLVRSVRDALGGGIAFMLKNHAAYRDHTFDREAGFLDSSFQALLRWPLKTMRMAAIGYTNFLSKTPDLTKKYVYLPLHKAPEVKDMFYGERYAHHESFVTAVAKKLPSEYRLYVKDHTSMIGNRTLGFYRRLQELYNVEVIHPNVSTFDLIRHCDATLTVTGTAGWEAYLLDKPVIVLGDTFYNFLPNLLHADLHAPDFNQQLKSFLAAHKAIPGLAQKALRAHYLSAFSSTGYHRDMDDLAQHASEYAATTHLLFRQWKHWILQNDPRSNHETQGSKQ